MIGVVALQSNTAYAITVNVPQRIVYVALSGFWSVEEAKSFSRDQQAAVRKLGPPFGTHLTLADVREFAIQTQEVSAIIRDLVLNASATSKRIALVGSEGLARMQFRRITERQDVRRFEDFEAAEAWLVDEKRVTVG